MAHHNTVFAQWLKLVPRHEFESLANQHHCGRKLRKMTRWAQFVAMAAAQLSGRNSLRDVVSNLMAQTQKLYHLGVRCVSRSSLSRVNESQPYELYEALFAKLLARCQSRAPKHQFKFKNKLYSLDTSTIDLCLSVFPWARFRATKIERRSVLKSKGLTSNQTISRSFGRNQLRRFWKKLIGQGRRPLPAHGALRTSITRTLNTAILC